MAIYITFYIGVLGLVLPLPYTPYSQFLIGLPLLIAAYFISEWLTLNYQKLLQALKN